MTDGDFRAGDARTAMVQELQKLRHGAGINAPDILLRVGPLLRTAVGIRATDLATQQRRRLVARITTLLRTMPEHQQRAVSMAFALHPDVQDHRFLQERMDRLAKIIDRDRRTAVRRVDEALPVLADLLLTSDPGDPGAAGAPGGPGSSAFAPHGWYVESMRSTLMLHVDPVQLQETRRVVATQDRLERLAVSWSIPVDVPEHLADLRIDVLYGGQLDKDETISTPTYWSGWMKLPQPLSVGQTHEYAVTVNTLPRRLFQPYYVLSPFRRCDTFVLRAKFDPADPPLRVWALDGVPFQLVNENQNVGEMLTADRVGEVSRTYRHLQQGLSYGLRWQARPD